MSWEAVLARSDIEEIRAFIEDAVDRFDPRVEKCLGDVVVHFDLDPYHVPGWYEDLVDIVYTYDVSNLSVEQRVYRWQIAPIWSRFEKLDLSDLLDMYDRMWSWHYRGNPDEFKHRILEKINSDSLDAGQFVKEYGEENFLRLVKRDLLKFFERNLKNLPLLWKAYEKLGKNPLDKIYFGTAWQEAVGRTKQEFINVFGQEVYDYAEKEISSYLVPNGGLNLSNLDEYIQEVKTLRDYSRCEDRLKSVLKDVLSDYSLSEMSALRKSTLKFFLNLGATTKEQYIAASMEVKLEDHHAFGDRKESLTYLTNLLKKNNNSLNWHDFLKQTGLTQENDKQHYLFFRNIFTHQPKHTVTDNTLKNIKTDEVRYPLSYDTYDGDQQNTTRTEQLLIKLDLPPQYQTIINSDQTVKAFFNHVMINTRMVNHPKCFAWARVSLINKSEWLVDEIQSDFMYGTHKYPGLAAYRAKPELLNYLNISEEGFKRIDGVMSKLLGNWHQVLLSAVMQAARNNNVKHVHMSATEHMKEKAYMSSANKLNKIYDKLPQDFHFEKKDISVPVKDSSPINKPFWTREARVVKSYLKRKH